MSSTSYCFEKLYEAIYRPETGHPQLALCEGGYIDQILQTVDRLKDRLQSEGRINEYHGVIDKLEELRKYFSEYPNAGIKKRDAYRLREDVYKQVVKWNNGVLPG